MTTSDKLILAVGPIIGLCIGMLAFQLDMTALREANAITLGALPLAVLAGPGLLGIKYAVRAIKG